MSDFNLEAWTIDRLLSEVTETVNSYNRVAARVFPNGVLLECQEPFCGERLRATTEEVARFMNRGWPHHHDTTMRVIPESEWEPEHE